jgi:hypothetical protein
MTTKPTTAIPEGVLNPECIIKDSNFSQESLADGEFANSSQAKCHEQCQLNPWCKWWTLDVNNICSLKASNSYKYKQKGSVVSSRQCPPEDIIPGDCADDNVNYDNNDNLKGSPTTGGTYENCRDDCQANPDCRYFSYQLDTKNCWLKTTMNGRKIDAKFLSGSDCLLARCGSDASYVYWNSNDIKPVQEAPNAGECEFNCADEHECKFWTFQFSTKKCWLKSSNIGREHNYGYTSGQSCDSPVVSFYLISIIIL